jgi:ADP-ribose pyrophosphatase
MSEHKPNGAAAGWERLQTDYPFRSPVFSLRRDKVRVGNQHEFEFTYLESKGAVWVVPQTADGQIVLIRQYRYAVDEWLWEVPAGGLFDYEGEPEQLARKELAEEVGGEAASYQYLGWFYGGAATTNAKCHVYIAHDTRLIHPQRLEAAETLERHPVPLEDAIRMAKTGGMRDGRSALALLWAEPYLQDANRAK